MVLYEYVIIYFQSAQVTAAMNTIEHTLYRRSLDQFIPEDKFLEAKFLWQRLKYMLPNCCPQTL